jgi:hypothetical protein
MVRFPCSGIFASPTAVQILFNRLLLQSNDISFVAQLSFFKRSMGKRHRPMRRIFSENGNLTHHSERLAGTKKNEGGTNNWNDHKSVVTLWLVVLFALWVVLTTALAVTARHSKSRKTLQPPAAIALESYSWPPYRSTYSRACRRVHNHICGEIPHDPDAHIQLARV